MSRCLIALGANIGDTQHNVRHAIELLDGRSSLTVKAVSSIFKTEAVGGPENQPQFANAAAVIETGSSAIELIGVLLDVERELGRKRDVRWQARTLDLDLLLFENTVLERPGFVVPHPRMSFRRFVLEPAAEIAGDMLHPISGMTISELLAAINDPGGIIAINAANTESAQQLADAIADTGKTDTDDAYQEITVASNLSELTLKLCVAVVQPGEKDVDCLQTLARKELFPDLRSPMLVVSGDDVNCAAKELKAAIEAMR